MRILYGVHGYGRGHATRTRAVLPHLAARHELLILAGGDAYQTLSPDYPVVRIPTLGFAYSSGPKARCRCHWQTLRHNLPAALDLLCGGPTFALVRGVVQEFAPDVVISDAEAWTHQVAAALGIPRLGFDHIGILAHCRPPLDPGDRLEARVDRACYLLLMGRPDRVLVSSFYDAPPRRPGVRVVPALPRQAVRDLTPTAGDALLVYLNRGRDQLSDGVLQALHGLSCPVRVYGTPRQGRDGLLHFLPPSELPFLEDLARCRAVVSTAGNQLVGEAMHLGKPVLVFPERSVEQRLNARAVERLGIGMRASFRDFTTARIRQFLGRLDVFTENIRRHRRDGLPEALAALDQFLGELVPAGRPTPPPDAGVTSLQLRRPAAEVAP
jgi:uncharacterized protein (TIGR00661 family)